jgi:phosphatidylinositol-3-phosphatase
MRRTRLVGVALAVLLLVSMASLSRSSAVTPRLAVAGGECGALSSLTPPVTYTHVIWIWMENKSYRSIVGNASAPYLNSTVAPDCGVATNYFNVTHPSLPNYLAATSGNTNNIATDCSPTRCPDGNPSIFGQLSAAGKTWRAYQESMPTNCDKSGYPSTAPLYTPRHNPPVYYTDAATLCVTADVRMGDSTTGSFAVDLANGTLPDFSFVTPNLTDDMHSGTNQVANGDAWLSQWLPQIIASPGYSAGTTAVFITWDEGTGPTSATTNFKGEDCTTTLTDKSCHVATFVISPYTAPGTKSATYFNHYSLLRTTENMLGLPPLDQAANATTMRTDFHL